MGVFNIRGGGGGVVLLGRVGLFLGASWSRDDISSLGKVSGPMMLLLRVNWGQC